MRPGVRAIAGAPGALRPKIGGGYLTVTAFIGRYDRERSVQRQSSPDLLADVANDVLFGRGQFDIAVLSEVVYGGVDYRPKRVAFEINVRMTHLSINANAALSQSGIWSGDRGSLQAPPRTGPRRSSFR